MANTFNELAEGHFAKSESSEYCQLGVIGEI